MLSAADKKAVADALHHDAYCVSCLAAEEDGTLATRLGALRRPRYCWACDEGHPTVLFLPEDLDKHDRDLTKLVCVGRAGHVTLCNHHRCNTITWEHMENLVGQANRDREQASACVDRSLEPYWRRTIRQEQTAGSAFPRLIAQCISQASQRPIFDLGYGWDLPLLQVPDLPWTPRVLARLLPVVHDKLSSLVVGALRNHKLCPHISAETDLPLYIRSGICRCFLDSLLHEFPVSILKNCKCKRKITLDCRVCGAVYIWHFVAGRIILSLRYIRKIQRPTSLAWLALLDNQFRQQFHAPQNRHVLWCDTPSCRTNTSGRWDSLIKEYAENQYTLASDDELSSFWDYEESCRAAQESCLRTW
ncbi:hypothetical protein E4U41_005230 [Claviceps citrina]|nr:hypothetical protein E4U41_005230 [Claviceps citrina]